MAERMWIDGTAEAAESGATFPIVRPVDGATIAEVPLGGRADARRAVDAARRAFDRGPWPRWTPKARGEVFLKAAALLTARLGPLAELESLNQGKTIKQAADADLPFAIDNL
ncbi:Aldehyde dehydrogenase domain protein, partial [mine drainage metagenome]